MAPLYPNNYEGVRRYPSRPAKREIKSRTVRGGFTRRGRLFDPRTARVLRPRSVCGIVRAGVDLTARDEVVA